MSSDTRSMSGSGLKDVEDDTIPPASQPPQQQPIVPAIDALATAEIQLTNTPERLSSFPIIRHTPSEMLNIEEPPMRPILSRHRKGLLSWLWHGSDEEHACEIWTDDTSCIRTRKRHVGTPSGRLTEDSLWPMMDSQGNPALYLIIGMFNKNQSVPKERIIVLRDKKLTLFDALHSEWARLRGWRRFISLKHVSRFGLFKVRDIPWASISWSNI